MTTFLLRLFVKDYTHTETPAVRSAIGKFAGIVGIVCNLILFLGKPSDTKDSRRVQEPGGLDAKRLRTRLHTQTWIPSGLPPRPAALRFSRLG